VDTSDTHKLHISLTVIPVFLNLQLIHLNQSNQTYLNNFIISNKLDTSFKLKSILFALRIQSCLMAADNMLRKTSEIKVFNELIFKNRILSLSKTICKLSYSSDDASSIIISSIEILLLFEIIFNTLIKIFCIDDMALSTFIISF